jgi:hypothetical protein
MAVEPPVDPLTPVAFMEQLRKLKEQSGLSYRQIERAATRNGDVLPASTLATALNRDTLPREDLLAVFVRACGADPDAWTAARRRLVAPEPAPEPEPAPASAAATRRGRRPWRNRGAVAGVVVTGVLTLLAVLAIPGIFPRQRAATPASGTSVCQGADMRMDPATGECWGLSDGTETFSPTPALLTRVIGVIDQQNLRSAATHRQQPERPYVTLAYVGALTSRDTFPTTLVAERETLEGIAAAQELSLERDTPGAPLVNILIANGAAGMAHGVQTARMLARWPLDSTTGRPGVIGAVGLDQSRSNTLDTIRALGREGIPMMAAALSADQLTTASPLYFQVSPQDRWAAAVDAAFITAQGARSVEIYHSADPTDLYSANLTADLASALSSGGVKVDQSPFEPALARMPSMPSADEAGASACGSPGLVYYAGRAEDFADFLNGIYSACGNTPPQILADDDITRYVADPRLRGMYRSIPFHYTSFAIAPESCQQGAGNTFYAALDTLFPFECDDQGRSLDGHAALGYDSTLTMLTALEKLGPTAVRATLAKALEGIHIGGAASAPITIGDDHVPARKMVAILTVAHGLPPTLDGSCGEEATGQAPWCP